MSLSKMVTERIFANHQTLRISGSDNDFVVWADDEIKASGIELKGEAVSIMCSLIAGDPETYKPDPESLSENLRNVYTSTLDEINEACCLPLEVDQYDQHQTWAIQSNLGLVWVWHESCLIELSESEKA